MSLLLESSVLGVAVGARAVAAPDVAVARDGERGRGARDLVGVDLAAAAAGGHERGDGDQEGEEGCARRAHGGGRVSAAARPCGGRRCGQSLRSFWASWSHQLQKRRFSTAHGSDDSDGAAGSTLPTISIGSPVSRSR